MMAPVHRIDGEHASAELGSIEVDPGKATWTLGMISLAVVLGPATFSASALILFLTLTYTSLLIGHSAGMHRMMIHRAFRAKPWVERGLIYVGVLVGMAGPFGIMRVHDTRDWAQRQPVCHAFFNHSAPLTQDLWWQLTHRFRFDHPPLFQPEAHYADDPFYQWLDRTWAWHQLPLALLLFLAGGWSFVVWGVFVRIAVSIVGHWTITYFCHNPGPGRWRVVGAGVQASNLPGLGLLTYGECWHNNHHAFPESAQIGLEPGQADPAFWFIQLLEKLGLADHIGKPREHSKREDLDSTHREHRVHR